MLSFLRYCGFDDSVVVSTASLSLDWDKATFHFVSKPLHFKFFFKMWSVLGLIFFCGFVWAQTDYVPTNYMEVTKSTLGDLEAQKKCGEDGEKAKCVPYHRCDPDTNTIKPEEEDADDELTDYGVLIDIRLGENNPCPTESLDVCCKIPDGGNSPKPTSPMPPSPPPDEQTDKPTPPAPPPALSYCGIRNDNGIDFKITGNTHNEAEYGEFPWMVAVLKTNYNPSVDPALAICGGSLIAPRVVLTGAHCVHKYQVGDIKVRAGEWDTQTINERFPYQERNVAEIIIHEGFKDGVLINDVALLVLEKPFKKSRHIGTICLPDQNEIINSKECYATGWGKNLFGREGEYQVILKKIDLPIVPRAECEAALKKTRLGSHFRLHKSFTCAGGVPGKDTCTGDGGSPLVCPDSKNPARYVQAGIVAWGIGCGTTVPGVYADVTKFRNWVDGQMQRLNLNNTPYVT